MGRIVTFYSYKGGVGRTSALANVAVLLAKYRKNVLLMDWDLEAPGLDRYFSAYINSATEKSKGLIHLLTQAGIEPHIGWSSFVTPIEIEGCSPISIIMSGDHDRDYVERIRSFSWADFFENHQGASILDRWRIEWKSKYDFVLIDSRTGITDVGGVCTVFLPDILVLVFSANEQSFEGGLQVAMGIQESRRNLEVPRAPLAILPLPGRFDGRDEIDEASLWLDRFSRELKPFYDDWLPNQFGPRRMLELTKIPYITKFSFGEPLPVLMPGISDPELPGFYLNNVARLIASDFADAHQILSPDVSIIQTVTADLRGKLAETPADEASIERLLATAESQFGDSVEFCELLLEVGLSVARQGSHLAEACFRRAVATASTIFPPDHPLLLSSMNNLANFLYETDELGEAEELYREVLNRLRQKAEGRESAVTAACISLANVLHAKGSLREAEELYREAIGLLRTISRPGDPVLIRTYSSFAGLLREEGNLGEAEENYREILRVMQQSARPDNAALGRAYRDLAEVLHEKGNLSEAEDSYRSALELLRQSSRPNDPALARAYRDLALVNREKGNLVEAQGLYREALRLVRETSRPGDPALARAYRDLAGVLRIMGNEEEAEHLYREALQLLQLTSRPGNSLLARAYSDLARLLRVQGRLSEAEEIYRSTVETYRQSSRPGDLALLGAYSELAGFLDEVGNHAEAESLTGKQEIAFVALVERMNLR
jgi:tetratricopeptide (TPR) repeat protein/MinD-like ATPase involved in chromosome partitioning or flagellar assembly